MARVNLAATASSCIVYDYHTQRETRIDLKLNLKLDRADSGGGDQGVLLLPLGNWLSLYLIWGCPFQFAFAHP